MKTVKWKLAIRDKPYMSHCPLTTTLKRERCQSRAGKHDQPVVKQDTAAYARPQVKDDWAPLVANNCPSHNGTR